MCERYLTLCSLVAGHPKSSKVAVFDIITPDRESGPCAAVAEAIAIVNDCLDSFANLDKYDIYISHTKSKCCTTTTGDSANITSLSLRSSF